jgi:hypothetical protein
MARNMEASWQLIFSATNKKKRCAEENTTRPRLRKKKPQHPSTQNQSKTLKLSINIIKQQTHNISTA